MRPHIVFESFSPVHTTMPYPFENAFIPAVRMLKWTRCMCISLYRPTKLAWNWSHMVKKHCLQIASLWRAFSNGSVFSYHFRHCSVYDSCIRSKTALFSFENGLVWTGPNSMHLTPVYWWVIVWVVLLPVLHRIERNIRAWLLQ